MYRTSFAKAAAKFAAVAGIADDAGVDVGVVQSGGIDPGADGEILAAGKPEGGSG